ncbi:MAG TPA: tyrosine-type recombinase/integrase [Bryobacteraceae bacterium]|jgi:integrase|nr:tyrosine-type recombinase/integrase [Bryobacteraceae bacterium]
MSELAVRHLAPELEAVERLVLDAVSSPLTRAMYRRALGDFFEWREQQGRPAFSRAAVQAHRGVLESKGYAPSTINQRLAAIKKLAREAAAGGLLDAGTAAGIDQVPGARQQGVRAGNWLTKAQAEVLLNAPDATTLKGRRDRALLALLLGCGLRRGEAVALTVEHIQQRDGRWVIVDLRGKHGRIRTVPVPAWVKQALDVWTQAAGIADSRLLRSLNRHGRIIGDSMSPQAVLAVVVSYGRELGLKLKPHDLRRTCAKLCRATGGELEQIQLLLGHASIQTTERYLGSRQNLIDAPNDHLGLGWNSGTSLPTQA